MFEKFKSPMLKKCVCENCRESKKETISLVINHDIQVMCKECWEELAKFIEDNKGE